MHPVPNPIFTLKENTQPQLDNGKTKKEITEKKKRKREKKKKMTETDTRAAPRGQVII